MITTVVLILQIVGFFLNIGIGAVGIAVPYLILKKPSKKTDRIMSFLNCASGGVLAAVSFVHVLPTCGDTLNAKLNHFPLSYFITFFGLIIMVGLVKMGAHNDEHVESTQLMQQDKKSKPEKHSNEINSQESLEVPVSPDPDSQNEMSASEHNVNIADRAATQNKQAVVMLLVGLTIHDISEGISLGLMTDLSHFIALFFAIFFHKSCEQICQAICGIRQGLTLKQNLMYLIPLCLVTPVFQLISFFIIYGTQAEAAELPQAALVTQDVFLSFAAGTFIGICFEEVIEHEMSHHEKRLEIFYKLLTFLLGFAFISAIVVFEFFFVPA